MLGRRHWLRAAMAGTLVLLPWRKLPAQEGVSFNGAEQDTSRIAPLADQLKNGLRVVAPDQMQFVQVVVAYVEMGKIPRAMVNLVYKWALERNPRVPFPYFQFAMKVLAKRRGVNLPNALPTT